MMTQPETPYLSTRNAARYLGIGESTLEKLRVLGGGPRFCKPLRRVLYRKTDLDEFMTAHRRRSTSEGGVAA